MFLYGKSQMDSAANGFVEAESSTFTRSIGSRATSVSSSHQGAAMSVLSVCLLLLCITSTSLQQLPPVGGISGNFGGNVVAFSYNRGFVNANNPSRSKYITFQNEITNVNADFRNDYGTFVCHQPGLYFFSFSGLTNALEDFRIALKRNYDTIATAYGSSKDFTMGSNSAIIGLQKGEIVYLEVEQGAIYESSVKSRAYASFNGYLIQAGDYHSKIVPSQVGHRFRSTFTPPSSSNGPMISFDSDGITISAPDIFTLLGYRKS